MYWCLRNSNIFVFYYFDYLLDKNIIILGPGPITAHQKDERIQKESFNKCQEIYRKIILEQQ